MAVRCILRIIENKKLAFELIKCNKTSNLLNEHSKVAAKLFSTGRVPVYSAKQTDDEMYKTSIEVYSGPLASRIKKIKMFSLLTSGLGLSLQPILIDKWSSQPPSIPIIVTILTIIGFHTYATPILLHLITKKYVLSLHYNEDADVYIARTYTLFLKDKLMFFKPEDVVVPDVPGMFTSFLVKGEPLFVEMSHFKDVDHYKKIMGYDKPIDFKLNTAAESLKQPTDEK